MTVLDGRVQRGERNREAIIDALLACYEAGDLQPSVSDVAARAGVSARSVHNHFVDVEALRAEVAQRQWQRFAHMTAPTASVAELVEWRTALFEAVTPVRRAALLSVHASPTIARNLGRFDRLLRKQVSATIGPVPPPVLDACDAIASWDTWNRLRGAQGCGIAAAREVVLLLLQSVLEGSRS